MVGGCVGQVGMQTGNVTRTVWLNAGLPIEVAATTVDTQCGSSQQATNLAYALVAGRGRLGAGVRHRDHEQGSMGSTTPKDPDVGKPVNRNYWKQHELTSQFEGAERIAEKWGISREAVRCVRQAVTGPRGRLRGPRVATTRRSSDRRTRARRGRQAHRHATHQVSRDEGVRETTLEGLAALKPTGRPDGVHTAGTSSQISDGAGACCS